MEIIPHSSFSFHFYLFSQIQKPEHTFRGLPENQQVADPYLWQSDSNKNKANQGSRYYLFKEEEATSVSDPAKGCVASARIGT